MGRHATDKVQRTMGMQQKYCCYRRQAAEDMQQTADNEHTTTRSSKHTPMSSNSEGVADGGDMRKEDCSPRGPHLILLRGCHRRLRLRHTILLCQRLHLRACARTCASVCVKRQHAADTVLHKRIGGKQQQATCSRRRATNNMRQTTCSSPHAAENVQQRTCSRQRA